MVKKLRSLIHEILPFDLRVEIELLNRRRDIQNEEKQDELLGLLRKYEIENVVQLGPGTNRYAARINGFVVKFATDHDGKIDNFKEFKMAKRFYPYVTKIYEVSQNGDLLVAEYIQPFGSFAEMCQYADKIRKILSEISSVYLIGDVGISSVNFTNWGLRIGNDEPVCLDFAYAYEVSSELFICRKCKAGAMLVPDKDFAVLKCPSCGKTTIFEDIRGRIGNDIHNHEIGDLTEEGYLLSESNMLVELDENRSNYLKHKNDESTDEDNQDGENNIVSEDLQNYEKKEEEDDEMDNMDKMRSIGSSITRNSMVVSARTSRPKPPEDPNNRKPTKPERIQIKATVKSMEKHNSEDEEVAKPEESILAFSGKIEPANPVTVAEPVIEKDQVVSAPQPEQQEEPKVPQEDKLHISGHLKNNPSKAVSVVANIMGNYLHKLDVFNEVKMHITDKKMFADTFYKQCQSALYWSLCSFLEFVEREVPNQKNPNKTHIEYDVPELLDNHLGTWYFIGTIFDNKDINTIEDPIELLAAQRAAFGIDTGINGNWIPILKERLALKKNIREAGIDMIADIIESGWCNPLIVTTDVQEPEVEEPEEPEEVVEEDASEEDANAGEGYFTDDGDHLYIEIYLSDDSNEYDDIRINSSDACGEIRIPFITKLDDIDPNESLDNICYYKENGYWDWLVNMAPDMVFRTKTPDRYLATNFEANSDMQSRVVIMDEDDQGNYIMAVHYITTIAIMDDDGGYAVYDEDLLKRLNVVFSKGLNYSVLSCRDQILSFPKLIRDERYALSMYQVDPDDEEEDYSNGQSEYDISDKEIAAIDEILGKNEQEDEPDDANREDIEQVLEKAEVLDRTGKTIAEPSLRYQADPQPEPAEQSDDDFLKPIYGRYR